MHRFVVSAALAVSLVLGSTLAVGAEGKKKLGEAEGGFRAVAVGTVLEVPVEDTLAAAEREYLGLGVAERFTIAGVKGDLVVVEFFNASCYACALMAPVMDEAWRRIDARAELRGRVRFVGIGVGNTPEQVREFHGRYDTPFPMLADPEFAVFDALGTTEGTPYLMLLRRDAAGSISARAQVGHVPDAGKVVAEIEAALADAPLADAAPRELAGGGWRTLKPMIAPAELEARLGAAGASAGLAGATVTAVPLASGETFYRLAAGGRTLWAFVAGRARVCNVCHDIFFIVLFDDRGTVVGLEPITITKYKNVEFNEEDTAFLRGRIVGRPLSRDIVFDPTVDAVSTATMSSSLVFDTLRRLGDTWKAMVDAGRGQP